jgi:hypothetical protein
MNQQPLQNSSARLDGVAVFLSGACMLHCLLLPILVTLFPIVQGSLLQEQDFHVIMLFLILPTSLFALMVGCRKHKDGVTITLGAAGLAVLAVTALFGHEWLGFLAERLVTTAGGLILASAHVRNYLLCRRVDCDHDPQPGESGPPLEPQ